ncbi:uncharacterized protein TNCV_2563721 [Trichonephila clavipes]|nr:uncharacterized protein TNCV_2563721 [Trichonephila clavipes]
MANEMIEKVLSNKILKDAIQDLCEPGVMNLIDPNWELILQNSLVYQKHENENVFGKGYNSAGAKIPITKYYIMDTDNNFDILVVGEFRITKDDSIQKHKCKPLDKIEYIMCKEKCPPSTFFMESCNGICPECRKFKNIENNKWCMMETKCFTRTGLYSASKEYFKNIFNNSEALAIARIRINMKYQFMNNVKIGGKIKSIIFIKDNLLRNTNDMSQVLTLDKSHCVPAQLPDNSILAVPKEYPDSAVPKEYPDNSILAVPKEYEVQSSSLTEI